MSSEKFPLSNILVVSGMTLYVPSLNCPNESWLMKRDSMIRKAFIRSVA